MKHFVILLYNSYKDPLCQGLLVSYVKEIAKEGNYHFHIVSYEQEKFKLTKEEELKEKEVLAGLNISWYPMAFHTGKFILFKKGYDLMRGLELIIRLKLQFKTSAIVCFANIAGAFGYVASRLTGMKVVVFSYEPHSEFLKELGIWSERSMKFRILNNLEYLLGKNGDYIITGTKYMVERLQQQKAKGRFFRLPTSVDEQMFLFNEGKRNQIRKQLNIDDRIVVIYTGKFGDLYYKDEIFELAKTLYQNDQKFFFLFLTGHDKNEVAEMFKLRSIPDTAFHINRVPLHEVGNYLSAADIGLVTVAKFPARKYCSPTKVGEYLCNGLPYIVTKGTSEDDIYALEHNVGVVVDGFEGKHVQKKFEEIKSLLSEEKNVLVERCRKVGVAYRGKGNAVALFSKVFEQL